MTKMAEESNNIAQQAASDYQSKRRNEILEVVPELRDLPFIKLPWYSKHRLLKTHSYMGHNWVTVKTLGYGGPWIVMCVFCGAVFREWQNREKDER